MSSLSSHTEPSPNVLTEAFCSYCGYPPRAGWRERPERVCKRCKLGVVLRTVPDAAPHRSDPFVIVNERLAVRGISRRAETVLRVDEPAAADIPLNEFLVSDGGKPGDVELARLVALAASGAGPSLTLTLRTVGDPQLRFRARITSCGPPLAALLVLGPLHDRAAKHDRAIGPARRTGVAEPSGRVARLAGRERRGGSGAPGASGDTQRLERDLVRISAVLAALGKRLERPGDEGVGEALRSVAEVRFELERVERELVTLARRTGRSWAEIGAELNLIIPRKPDPDVTAALRHARRRRSANGADGSEDTVDSMTQY
jgi:hypothetical protein